MAVVGITMEIKLIFIVSATKVKVMITTAMKIQAIFVVRTMIVSGLYC